MDQPAAECFAEEWAKAWNDHDVDRVLSHFSDDVTWTSPVAAEMVDGSGGVLRGKEALRAYFGSAIGQGLDLHFDILAVYSGVNTIVINYRNQRGGVANEVLVLGDDGLVHEGHGTYLTTGASDQGMPGTR